MDIKNILETVFLRAPVALFEFVAGCWDEHPLITLAVLLTTICIFFAVATVLVLRENLIAGILCLAFFGAVLAPTGHVVMVLVLRDQGAPLCRELPALMPVSLTACGGKKKTGTASAA